MFARDWGTRMLEPLRVSTSETGCRHTCRVRWDRPRSPWEPPWCSRKNGTARGPSVPSFPVIPQNGSSYRSAASMACSRHTCPRPWSDRDRLGLSRRPSWQGPTWSGSGSCRRQHWWEGCSSRSPVCIVPARSGRPCPCRRIQVTCRTCRSKWSLASWGCCLTLVSRLCWRESSGIRCRRQGTASILGGLWSISPWRENNHRRMRADVAGGAWRTTPWCTRVGRV